MSHFRNNVNKFSNFEPEVDDAIINKSWEKVKYFLPIQKKRRRFILLLNGYFFAACIFGLLVGVGIYLENIHKQHQALSVNNNPALKKNHLKKGVGKRKIKTYPYKSNLSRTKDGITSISSLLTVVSSKKQTVKKEPSFYNSKNESQVRKNAAGGSYKDTMINAKGETIQNVIAINGELMVTGNESGEFTEMDKKVINALPDTINVGEAPLTFSALKMDSNVTKLQGKKLGFEIFAGPDITTTQIKNLNQDMQNVYRRTGASIGLGINYALSKKTCIVGQLSVNKDVTYYNLESIENKIVDKTAYLNVQGSPFAPADTSIRYVLVHKENKLSTSYNYNMGLGLGYNLYEKNKIGLTAFVQFNVKYEKFMYSGKSYSDTDTLTYIRHSYSAALPNSIPNKTPDSEYKRNYPLTSIGMLGGLTFTYKLHPKYKIIFKPCYFKDLAKNTITSNQSRFIINQNKLFLNFGLQMQF